MERPRPPCLNSVMNFIDVIKLSKTPVITIAMGKAYSAGAAYLFNEAVGWGKFMPFVRYQTFEPDTNIVVKKYEVGTNYVIAPYNALITAVYSDTKTDGANNVNAFNVSMQFQF